MSPLGDAIRERRNEVGLSQPALAAAAGWDKGYLSRVENGERKRPSAAKLAALAKPLRVEPADLIRVAAQGGRLSPDGRDVRASPDGTGGRANATAGLSPLPHNGADVHNVVGRISDLYPPGTSALPVYAWGTAGNPASETDAPAPLRMQHPPLEQIVTIGPRGFGVLVRGNSMTHRGINEGDIAWVNPDAALRLNRPVLAELVDATGERGMVVKVYMLAADGSPALRSDGDDDRLVLGEQFNIIGPVVWVQPPGHAPR